MSCSRHLRVRPMLAVLFVLLCGSCGSGGSAAPTDWGGQASVSPGVGSSGATASTVASPGQGAAASCNDGSVRASVPRLVGPGAARWWHVLTRLDRARAEAFHRLRPGPLRDVYARGSTLARHDRAVLAAYRARGVRLSPVRLDVTALRVTSSASAAASLRVSLRVVECLAPTTAVLSDGDRVALPADAPTRRALRLVRTADGWRIAAVRRLAG